MLHKLSISCLSIVLSLGLILASSQTSAAEPTPAVKVTIAQFGHVFLYLPLYVAQHKGYFAAEGLTVDLVSTGGDEKTFAAVASGSAQFGVADPVFTAIARAQGHEGKVIAALVSGLPFWGVTFKPEIHPFTTADGFAGQRVATYTAPSTNYTAMKDTLQNNGTPVDATIVEGAFGSLLALLKSGNADIAMELEPTASIAVAEGAHVVYSMADHYKGAVLTGVTTSTELLSAHPELAQKVVSALNQAVKFIHTDFEGAIAVAKAEFPETDEAVLRSALRRLLDDGIIPADLRVGESGWKNAVALRRSVGDLKADAPYGENVDMRFVDTLPAQ